MTVRRYKGYTIVVVGLSHYVWRNLVEGRRLSHGYAQSTAAAKRWINADRKRS